MMFLCKLQITIFKNNLHCYIFMYSLYIVVEEYEHHRLMNMHICSHTHVLCKYGYSVHM